MNDQWFINMIVVNTVTGEKMYWANKIATNLVAFTMRSVTEDLRARQAKAKQKIVVCFFSLKTR